jgi:hypothetical protein
LEQCAGPDGVRRFNDPVIETMRDSRIKGFKDQGFKDQGFGISDE